MLLWLCLARGAEWWPEGSRGLFNWNWAGGVGIVGRGLDVLKTPKNGAKICKNVNTSASVLSALKNLAQKMRKTKMRLKLARHYAQPIFRGQRIAQGAGGANEPHPGKHGAACTGRARHDRHIIEEV